VSKFIFAVDKFLSLKTRGMNYNLYWDFFSLQCMKNLFIFLVINT